MTPLVVLLFAFWIRDFVDSMQRRRGYQAKQSATIDKSRESAKHDDDVVVVSRVSVNDL